MKFKWLDRDKAVDKAAILMLDHGHSVTDAMHAVLTDEQYCKDLDGMTQSQRTRFMRDVKAKHDYRVESRRAAEKDRRDEESMKLAEGKTCVDCIHSTRCTTMFGSELTDTRCQWFPNRFREKTPVQAACIATSA